jgi:hypothetical protein
METMCPLFFLAHRVAPFTVGVFFKEFLTLIYFYKGYVLNLFSHSKSATQIYALQIYFFILDHI